MIEKEKRTLKDGVKNLIGKYKALEHGIIEVLENNILSFIDSLQEETKTDWLQELQERLDSLSKEDFEKVMAKYSRYGEKGSVDYDKLNTMLDESLSTETKESWNKRLGEEPVSEELEKMSYHSAMDLINNPKFLPTTTFGELIPLLQKLYKDGAKWQKEQMMAKAIDGTARPDDNEIWCILDSFNLKDGDEVKVIVIKKK